MTNLTYRAERALLGALLRDPGLLNDVRFLTVADFTSPSHRTIFEAIGSVQAGHPAGRGPSYVLAVALAAPGSGLDVHYLEQVARSCPEPANAAAYARMLMEAGLRRRLLSHAERLFQNAGDLHYEVGRFTKAAAGHGAELFPSHLIKLAHAMWIHARGLEPVPEDDDATPLTAETAVPEAEITAPGSRHDIQDSDVARLEEEEEVLADLIQHPRQNSDALEWLPAEAFLPGPRRKVYEAITALARAGEPVDELTVEWQLARQNGLESTGLAHAHMTREAKDTRVNSGYIGVLASLPVTDGTATVTGRTLLSRHTAAQCIDAAPELPAASGPDTSAGTPPVLSTRWRPGHERTQRSKELARRTSPPPSFGAATDLPACGLLPPRRGHASEPTERGPRPRP